MGVMNMSRLCLLEDSKKYTTTTAIFAGSLTGTYVSGTKLAQPRYSPKTDLPHNYFNNIRVKETHVKPFSYQTYALQ